MKALILFIFLSLTLRLSAQPDTYYSDDIFVPVGKATPSYKLYWLPASPFAIRRYKSRKILMRSVVIRKGREQAVAEYEWPRITRIIRYYYQDTFPVKALINFPFRRHIVKCQYKYDPVSHVLISKKWTSAGKVVFHSQRSQLHDTTLFTTFQDWNRQKFRSKEYQFTSHDSMTQTNILYLDHQSAPHYTIQRFDRARRLIEQTDSSGNNVTYKKFDYDASGRVIKEVWTPRWPILISEYVYREKETYSSTSCLYENNTKQLREEHVQRYDASGRLCFEEIKEYNKGETGDVSPGLVVRNYYSNSRLIKVQKYVNKELLNTYVIQYVPERKKL